MTEEILVAKDLSKSFGQLRVIQNLNITINKGDIYVLFGSNGAGKTTLVRLLSGLLHADSGDIQLFGMKPEDNKMKIKRRMGFMSHNPYLYDDLTALENLIFFGRLYSVENEEEKALKMLKMVGLKHRAHDQVGPFSRGMKQRLALARCLLHDPDLIFLDEPYSGLDMDVQVVLNELIMKMNQEGKTFFIITHDIEKGFDISRRSGILSRGSIVHEETGCDVKSFLVKYKKILQGESIERC